MRFFNARFLSFPWWQSYTAVPIIIKGMPSKFNFCPLTGCESSQKIMCDSVRTSIKKYKSDKLLAVPEVSATEATGEVDAHWKKPLARLIIRWDKIRLHTLLYSIAVLKMNASRYNAWITSQIYIFFSFFLTFGLWHKKVRV